MEHIGIDLAVALPRICALGLSFRVDGFRLIFAAITTYMWLMTSLFTPEYLAHYKNKGRYWFFLALTYIATMGVFLSDDLYTTFIFFELMSMASYVCVIHDEKPATLRAGGVYLAVAVIGGLVTLMGIFLLYHLTGTLSLGQLREACEPLLMGQVPGGRKWLFIAGLCILFGFGAKAGMFPLHIWLPMAHPVAPAPASALLSGIITKSGIFGLLVLTADIFPHDGPWGFMICLFGVVTMLLGGFLAVFSIDLKRTLACSSMSQLGMIVTGIGMQGLLGHHNALAVRGTILHMVNHASLKLVLFMAAGVVVMNLHKLDLNIIRGYGRKKPLLKAVFLSGALGIGGIPLFNGYVSKTLLHESIVEYIELLHEGGGWSLSFLSVHQAVVLFQVIEWLFLLTGGMTVAYMTKLFVCLFVEKNADGALQEKYDSATRYCTSLTAAVLCLSALVMPVFGLFPHRTLDALADLGQGFLHGASPAHPVAYFSFANLKGGLTSIAIGAVLYLFVVRKLLMARRSDGSSAYVDRWPARLDLLTLVYEPLIMRLLPNVFGFICRVLHFLSDGVITYVVSRAFPAVFGFVCRALNFLSDGIITFFVSRAFPAVFGFICRALNFLSDGVITLFASRIFPAVFGFVCRVLDFSTDGAILLLRQTTHRQGRERPVIPQGYRLSYYLGSFLNAVVRMLNRTARKDRPITKNYILFLAERQTIFREAHHMIQASASFSMLMLGIGLAAVVLYLLVL